MAEAFLTFSTDDRREALAVAADRPGRPAHLLEKDAWVVWTLATLFGSDLGEHLVFKGGTSLSKAYGVIRRFSEDVDLTYDIRALAPDLVGENDEALPKNRSEEKRWSTAVRHHAGIAAAALANRDLANAVARHKSMFFAEKAADGKAVDYEAAVTGKLQLVPSGEARVALTEDYERMIEDGLLLEDAEPFEALIERCADLAERANCTAE